jgi:hypothetical protein
MSRYICHFLVGASPKQVKVPLRELMQSCHMEMIYEIEDYMMAREIPGQVAFAKLVTTEVLIDITTATEDSVRLSFVVKNEELPLKNDNHCRQMFERLRDVIDTYHDWQAISSLNPVDAPTEENLGSVEPSETDELSGSN